MTVSIAKQIVGMFSMFVVNYQCAYTFKTCADATAEYFIPMKISVILV